MSNLKERIDHIESEKEWLDDHISEIFAKYREIYGISGNGVYDWELWSKTLVINQDVSCRGCHDTWRHDLPLEYLYSEDYESLIRRDFEKHQQEEKIRKDEEEEAREKAREERDKKDYERLKKKFEGDIS